MWVRDAAQAQRFAGDAQVEWAMERIELLDDAQTFRVDLTAVDLA